MAVAVVALSVSALPPATAAAAVCPVTVVSCDATAFVDRNLDAAAGWTSAITDVFCPGARVSVAAAVASLAPVLACMNENVTVVVVVVNQVVAVFCPPQGPNDSQGVGRCVARETGGAVAVSDAAVRVVCPAASAGAPASLMACPVGEAAAGFGTAIAGLQGSCPTGLETVTHAAGPCGVGAVAGAADVTAAVAAFQASAASVRTAGLGETQASAFGAEQSVRTEPGMAVARPAVWVNATDNGAGPLGGDRSLRVCAVAAVSFSDVNRNVDCALNHDGDSEDDVSEAVRGRDPASGAESSTPWYVRSLNGSTQAATLAGGATVGFANAVAAAVAGVFSPEGT